MMHQHNDITAIDVLHLALALVIAASYMAVPFTALARLSKFIPISARIAGTFFFLTCAITHIAIAASFHDSSWMVVNDLVQAVSVITFIAVLSRMVGAVMARRKDRLPGVAHVDNASTVPPA
jgi:uncharacterized membrane protein AbrB (regulator of aidB expression)